MLLRGEWICEKAGVELIRGGVATKTSRASDASGHIAVESMKAAADGEAPRLAGDDTHLLKDDVIIFRRAAGSSVDR